MRLEATIPDSRGIAVQKLADELGLSRSQVVDEALTLFLKAVLEARRGRRLVALDSTSQAVCELMTPTLTTLEWTLAHTSLDLPEAALARIQSLSKNPPKPSERLRDAGARRTR